MKKSNKLIIFFIIIDISIGMSLIIANSNIFFPKNLSSGNSEKPTLKASSDSYGIEVCKANNTQTLPVMCEDGNGGSIIAWSDFRNYVDILKSDIYAQRVDSNGNMKWLTDGIIIHNGSDPTFELEICSDGLGGAIIAWTNLIYISSPSKLEIFAQRIDSDGNTLWNNNGLHIANTSKLYPDLKLCGDGSGGAIFVWMDLDNMYTQRVDSNGDKLWSFEGKTLPKGYYPEICSDDMGGAIIIWNDARSGESWDIYAQRVDSNGNLTWHENGSAICNDDLDQMFPLVCSDGLGGAITIWRDERGGGYAQRIDSNGNSLWENNGTFVSEHSFEDMKSDGEHGMIFTYVDYWVIDYISYLYGQRIDSNGNKLWGVNGTKVFTSDHPDWFESPKICSDDRGGAIITWNYRKNWFEYEHPYNNTDIYVQKINSNGDRVWKENGIPVCVPASDFRIQDVIVQICNDGEGGAIISYEFVRTRWNEDYQARIPYLWDIHAQRISSGGDLQWNVEPDWIFFVIIGVIIGGIAIAVVITVVLIKRRK